MKGLSKKERLEQRIAELEKEILEMADKCGDKKWLRTKRTFFILIGIVYLIVFMCGGMNDINDCLGWIIAAPMMALFIMFISYGVMYYITENAMKEEKAIAQKIGELTAVKSEKYNNFEDEKIKELERHIKYLENHRKQLIEENTHLKLNKVFDNEVEKDEED